MTKYSLPLFARLEPQTAAFEGGRLADTDMLSLGEAAEMAAEHAGRTVRVSDFLRAGARGEIRLLAMVPRAATLLPIRASDEQVQAVAGAFTHLPMVACTALATTGAAEWRSIEGMERGEAGGERAFFDRWRLPDADPSFTVTLEGVRVQGRDVHALADAFKGPPPAPAPIAPRAEPGQSEPEKRAERQRTRLEACEAEGIVFDKRSLERLPDGIGKVAKKLEITRQSLTADVKAALKRRIEESRNGAA